MAFDRLIKRIQETGNPSVAGLDPKLDYVPAFIREKHFAADGMTLKAAANAIKEFNFALIDTLQMSFQPSSHRLLTMKCTDTRAFGCWRKPSLMHRANTYSSSLTASGMTSVQLCRHMQPLTWAA